MATAHVYEKSVTGKTNSRIQNYVHLDNEILLPHEGDAT